MDHTINIGTDLNGRKIIANIPDTTEITELKYIAKVNDDNYIAENKMTVEGQSEECSVGYYHYNDAIYIFYIRNSSEVITNLTNFTLPDDFGVCTEIDDTAILYDYIKRNCHEKVYVICEDFCKEESMTRDQIKDNVNEQVRGYGVPVDTVIGFTGTEEEIPPGYELSDEEIGGSGDDEHIKSIVENKILSAKSTSQTDAYSCEYINTIETAINNIVSSGSNDNGDYIKYSDGTMICHRKLEFSQDGDWEQDGAIYRTTRSDIAFAQEFIDVPTVNANVSLTGARTAWCCCNDMTTALIGTLYILNHWNASACVGTIDIVAYGKWK